VCRCCSESRCRYRRLVGLNLMLKHAIEYIHHVTTQWLPFELKKYLSNLSVVWEIQTTNNTMKRSAAASSHVPTRV